MISAVPRRRAWREDSSHKRRMSRNKDTHPCTSRPLDGSVQAIHRPGNLPARCAYRRVLLELACWEVHGNVFVDGLENQTF